MSPLDALPPSTLVAPAEVLLSAIVIVVGALSYHLQLMHIAKGENLDISARLTLFKLVVAFRSRPTVTCRATTTSKKYGFLKLVDFLACYLSNVMKEV